MRLSFSDVTYESNFMTKIYIIVPVYKVEKFLPYCVESLLNQTYKNINIVLVDDGSPDNCPQICDEYAQKDDRISVIHQNNTGLSGARSAGLEYVERIEKSYESAFVGFLDSDDWLARDTIEKCVALIKYNDADVVQYQIHETNLESFDVQQPKESITVCNGYEEILQYYLMSTTTGIGGDYSVCQCLFSLKAISGERFRIGKINEDIDFKYKVLAKCNRMVVTNQYKYFYRQGEVTMSMGGLKKKDFDLYEVGNILADLTSKETYGDIARLGKVKQARTPLSLLCKIAYFGVADYSVDKSSVIKQLTKEHRQNVFTLLKSPIPLSRKVLTVLFAINYKLAEICIRVAK